MLVVNTLTNHLLNVCSVLCLIPSANIGRKEKKKPYQLDEQNNVKAQIFKYIH